MEQVTEPAFRVLLVEDELLIRELVRSVLSESGIELVAAANGVEGLRLARSERFDLILLDVVLPELDGISVCRMLKSDPKTAHIALHMLSGRANQSDEQSAGRAGADGYIRKPFRAEELVGLVSRLRQR